jgi:hypothetical protein
MARNLGPADGCGNCLTAEHSETVSPYLVEPSETTGVRAYYRCPACGHRWHTSWAAGAEGGATLIDPFPKAGAA